MKNIGFRKELLFENCHHKDRQAYLRIKLEAEIRAPKPPAFERVEETKYKRKASLEARAKVGGRQGALEAWFGKCCCGEGAEEPGGAELGPRTEGLRPVCRTWHLAVTGPFQVAPVEFEDRRAKGVRARKWPPGTCTVFPALLRRAET